MALITDVYNLGLFLQIVVVPLEPSPIFLPLALIGRTESNILPINFEQPDYGRIRHEARHAWRKNGQQAG